MPFETRGVERRENARAPASERAITAFRHSPASPSAPRVDESSGAPRLLFGRNRCLRLVESTSHHTDDDCRRRIFYEKKKRRRLNRAEGTDALGTDPKPHLSCSFRFVRFVTPHNSSRQHTG